MTRVIVIIIVVIPTPRGSNESIYVKYLEACRDSINVSLFVTLAPVCEEDRGSWMGLKSCVEILALSLIIWVGMGKLQSHFQTVFYTCEMATITVHI